jgi:hypothetical protein|tara:strand:+ start:323 stop:529 length:207 start_codon:yes stop_codon:yes gene_type:complete
MSMLMMLKEGGDLVLEAKGNTKLDEDLDLTLNEAGGAGISLSLRIVYEGLSVTSVTATQVRAIVLGDS